LTLLRRLRRNLTSKLSVLVTLAVIVVIVVLGVYFDIFLRNSFLDSTSKRMQHAYQRLSYNLNRIEGELKKGTAFAKTDESLIASIELINRYQDKTNYNTFLIDEEKKTIAQQLLNRVKLSYNNDIALYGQDGQLIAYASREAAGFQLGYLSYRAGKPQVLVRRENDAEFRLGQLPAHGNIAQAHAGAMTGVQKETGHFTTYHHLADKLVIKDQQSVVDSKSGRVIADLELSNILDADYFTQLSKDLDLQLTLAFESEFAALARRLDSRGDIEALNVAQVRDQYLGILMKDTSNGPAYFTVALDKSLDNDIINTQRLQFLLMLVLLAFCVLLFTRFVIRSSLTHPLGVLMGQIRNVERGDYAPVSPVATGDELQEISISVNALATAVHDREASLQRSHNEQEYLSNHDSLTDLPNRRLFSQRLEHALDLARCNQSELAVFFLDLDQFKLINDTLGHEVGDQLLVLIGERLRKRLRATDTLARIGGDEFNLLVEGVSDLAGIALIAKEYIALFREPFVLGEHEISTTVSIGIAMFPKDGTDSVTLLKHADLAVYKSKDGGRDGFSFFSEDLSRRASMRSDMLHAIKLALDAGDQFALAYQPKVSAATGRVVSAEALIRWQSPEFGQVPPLDFIPLAEETGQILPIGAWVIRQGCRDLALLQASGIDLDHLSMNVSNVQLRDRDLGQILRHSIEVNGLQARQVELEITESYIARDVDQALLTLQEFRDMGIQLAIDDFGTGYSSMSYLYRMPFTRIKIDKLFVDGLPGNRDCVSITRAIIGLAKSFGLAITAEGVERDDQLRFLLQEQCDEIQGYYYAKPMPLDEFIVFCRQNLAA
jgi:diguanylate cyclase (GGDEF)-like protein